MKFNRFFNLFSAVLMACMLAFVAASCGDDPEDDIPSPPAHNTTVTEASIIDLLSSDAITDEIPFKATENWRVTSDADWCTVSPTQGTAGSKTITVTITENLSSEPRSAHIKITSIDNQNYSNTITIIQPAMEAKPAPEEDKNAPEGMKSPASVLVTKINVGWNLGNTCEAGIWDGWSGDDLDIETNWLNPKVKTSKAMFTALKNAGFNAVRIPTRWTVHADADMNINARWLARVKEIVDYAVSQDMYVILNSHHDNWYDRLPVGYNEADIHKKYENMWKQIATYFKDYDEHLIFAGANEIISVNGSSENWGNPSASDYKFVNSLMQLFVNTVRATGGNNEWRNIMVQPWACNPSFAIDDKFVLPTDTKENRLIVEYHCYDPYNYAIGKGQSGNQWAQHEPSQADLNYVANNFAKLNAKFISKGVPCIMAEFGSTQDNSYSKGNDAADKIRADYHKFIVSEAKKYDIPGFYWDNYCFTTTGENFGLLDRKNCNFPARAQIALKGIMDGLN
ncbi:MAG: cellulase family glycosylhydrolase [Prevotellaceae bacterium]|nr:cellulase family glycosylhydrolase [Candidatus Minthosoma caballi]